MTPVDEPYGQTGATDGVGQPDDVTREMPPVRASSAPDGAPIPDEGATASPDWDAFFEEDNDDEWRVETTTKRIRMRVPTAILLGLLLAAGAFWGGAVVQRGQGSASAFAGVASRLRGAAGASGASGFAALFRGRSGAAGGATEGTVTEVSGSTIYLTNAAGDIVKVVLGPSAKVSRTSSVSASALALGDTAVVQGTTAKNGTVTTTSVTATAAGTTTGGGFAGLGTNSSGGGG